METLLQDLRQAARMLLKNPGFTAIVLIALALGVGANTAIFSVVDNVLLAPLPYQDPDRLVGIWGRALDLGYPEIGLSDGELVELARDSRTLQDVAGFNYDGVTLTSDSGEAGEPERIQAAAVTTNLFATLGTPAIQGRLFSPEEEQEGRSRVALISQELWQRRFASDPDILKRKVRIEDDPYQVVGVLPAGFRLPSDLAGKEGVDVFIPMTLDRKNPRWTSHNTESVARLRPGVTLEQAQAEVATLADRMHKEHAMYYPPNAGLELLATPLHQKVVGDVRAPLLILLGAVALVLLIACANVANLLLARSETRQKEVAVRLALGAERRHLVRQFLTESLLYGLIGGGLGLLLALWALEALVAAGPEGIPRLETVGIDPRVLAFTLALSILAAIASGLFPALQVSRENLSPLLKEEGRGSTSGRRGQLFRRGLVVAEVALAVVLVISSGLLIRSFVSLQRVDLGFQPGDLLTLRISLPASKYSEGSATQAFYAAATQRLASLPGVSAAAAANVIPFGPGGWDTIFDIEGKPSALENPEAFGNLFPNANLRMITPEYFGTMGMPIQAGRDFLASDHGQANGVIAINETLARQFWPGQSPLGRRMRLYASESEKGGWLTIVGVVRDFKNNGVKDEVKPEMYIPIAQLQLALGELELRDANVVLRTAGDRDPVALAEGARQALRQVERDIAVFGIRTLDELISERFAQPRFNTLLITAFASLALALAMIGVYGVMSYSVARRTHEMGIRFALGAGAWDVLGLVVRQGMLLALAGLGIGLVAALAASRVLMSLLFGVGPFDALVYAQVSAALAAVALLACYLPARRAARVDPMAALKPN